MSQHDDSSTVLVLKLTVQDIEPPIWREVAVSKTETLDILHQIIQALFLWEDEHLHEFRAGDKSFTDLSRIESGEAEEFSEEQEVEIHTLLKKPKDKINYEYDFGDSWEIEIQMLRAIDSKEFPYVVLPACLAGERAAPLEDSGGPHAYPSLIDALKDPNSPEGREAVDWIGKPWNPDTFDINAANYILAIRLEGFYQNETSDILDELSKMVIGQLESKTPHFVETTFNRLTSQGLEQEAAISIIALAFARERQLSKGAEKINEKAYAKLLDQLPEMPWLAELGE